MNSYQTVLHRPVEPAHVCGKFAENSPKRRMRKSHLGNTCNRNLPQCHFGQFARYVLESSQLNAVYPVCEASGEPTMRLGKLSLFLCAVILTLSSFGVGHAQTTNTPRPAATNVLTEVKIAWDVLPGAPARIRERDVDAWKTSGSLVLKSVTTKVPGSFGRLDLLMLLTVWGVCLTAEDEVCGITRQGDTPLGGSRGRQRGLVQYKDSPRLLAAEHTSDG